MSTQFINTGVILFVMVGVLLGIFGKVRKIILAKIKASLIYLLIALVLFAAVGLICLPQQFGLYTSVQYDLASISFFLLGIFQVLAADSYFDWGEANKLGYKLLFHITILLLGMIAFSWVISTFGTPYYFLLFLRTGMTFLIPFLVWNTYLFAINIPAQVYKVWEFPKKSLPDPIEDEMRNPSIISLYFTKQENDEEPTHFRAKAFEGLSFGNFFYHFIEAYNSQYPQEHIDARGHHRGWIFYKKTFFGLARKRIDFDLTVQKNGVKENDKIICERV